MFSGPTADGSGLLTLSPRAMASFLFFCFSFFFIYKKEWLFGKIQGSVSLTATVRPTGDAVQAANLAGFRASEDPRFEAGIPDFMNGILNLSIHFNVVHRKVDWRNPKMKSLNSMPAHHSAMDK